MSIITKEIVVTDFKGPRHVWSHDCVFSICPQFTCQPGWNRMASFSGTSSVHSTFDLGHSVQPFLPAACGHTRPGIEDCPQRSPQGKEGGVPECLSRTYDVQSTSHVLSSLETQKSRTTRWYDTNYTRAAEGVPRRLLCTEHSPGQYGLMQRKTTHKS